MNGEGLLHGCGRRFTMVAAFIALAGGLAGCQAGGGSAAESSEPYTQSFSSGQYQQSYAQASSTAQSATGPEAERAALVAGMSASALGKPADAARWLTPLINSRDSEIAGRASWTLGKMADDQGRAADAANWYLRAANALRGDDAARAALSAGDALRRSGGDGADDAYALGLRKVEDSGLRSEIEQRQNGGGVPSTSVGTTVALSTNMSDQDRVRAMYATQGGYGTGHKYANATSLCDKPGVMGSSGPTVIGGSAAMSSGGSAGQVCQSVVVLPAPGGSSQFASSGTGRYLIQLGAFADQSRANQQLRAAQSAAAKAGTPSPQMVPTTDPSGKSLYAVRLGSYPSKAAAAADLQRLGLQGLVMAERH